MKKIRTKKYRYIFNNQNSQSFMLIEVVIYFSLLLLMTLIFSNFIKNTREFSSLSSKTANKLLRNNLFIDVLRRDLICASSKISDWDDSKLVFKKYFLNDFGEQNFNCIGYEVRKKSLFRIEGRYDFLNSRWNKRISSLLTSDIEDLKIKLNKNIDRAVSVDVEYKISKFQEPKNIFVKLRNT